VLDGRDYVSVAHYVLDQGGVIEAGAAGAMREDNERKWLRRVGDGRVVHGVGMKNSREHIRPVVAEVAPHAGLNLGHAIELGRAGEVRGRQGIHGLGGGIPKIHHQFAMCGWVPAIAVRPRTVHPVATDATDFERSCRRWDLLDRLAADGK
jgi:hypothetical protein